MTRSTVLADGSPHHRTVRLPTGFSAGLLLLRVITGTLLLVHGVPKLLAPAKATGYAASLGVPAPELAGWLVILGEVGLGALLVLGLLTRIAGGLAVVMMVGMWLVVYRPQGFLTDQGGLHGESALLYAVLGLVFLTLGGGRFSIERFLTRRS